MLYKKGEALEEYLARNGLSPEDKHPLSTFAFVSEDGWVSSGDMGWFGCSSNNEDELVWERKVEEFIAALPEEYWLVSVDCHI